MKRIALFLFLFCSCLFADELQQADKLVEMKQYEQAIKLLQSYDQKHPDEL